MKKQTNNLNPDPDMLAILESFEKSKKIKKNINNYEYFMSMDKSQLDKFLAGHGVDGDAAVKRIQQKIEELKASQKNISFSDLVTDGIVRFTGFLDGLLHPGSHSSPKFAMRNHGTTESINDSKQSALPFSLKTKRKTNDTDWRIRLDFFNPQIDPIHFEIVIDGQNVACKQTMGSNGEWCSLVFPGPDDLEQMFLEIMSKNGEENIYIFNFKTAE